VTTYILAVDLNLTSNKTFVPSGEDMHNELQTAIAAVVRASRLTRKIFTSLQAGQTSTAATVTKVDKSPVTIADYGSQAVVNAVLRSAFPNDPIVAEENAEELRRNSELRDKVWRLVSSSLKETPPDELASYGGRIDTPNEMMNLIDQGNSQGGSVGRKTTILRGADTRFLDIGSY
jgi:3'(2'), 5'-bisphosphate nucleotidase